MSTAVATASPTRAIAPRHAGWAGVTLGVAAWFITLPPALVRTPVPSILIGLLAITAGAWAINGGEKRLGWGAIAAGVVGALGAVASTKSGVSNLKDVVTWSALIAATLRYATPLVFGALGGIVSERSGVVNVGIEGMMLTGAFFGIFGADLLDSWFLGLLVGMAAGGVLALLHALCQLSHNLFALLAGALLFQRIHHVVFNRFERLRRRRLVLLHAQHNIMIGRQLHYFAVVMLFENFIAECGGAEFFIRE